MIALQTQIFENVLMIASGGLLGVILNFYIAKRKLKNADTTTFNDSFELLQSSYREEFERLQHSIAELIITEKECANRYEALREKYKDLQSKYEDLLVKLEVLEVELRLKENKKDI